MASAKVHPPRPSLVALLLASLLATGCATIDAEDKKYPDTWPAMVARKANACVAPVGMYANLPAREQYEYASSNNCCPPTLEQALGLTQSDQSVDYLRLDLPSARTLRVISYAVVEGAELQVNERTIDLEDADCTRDRLAIMTETTHASFSSNNDDTYNPLVTAAYVIGTFGMGGPISSWWDYRLAPGEDGSLIVRRLRMDSGLLFMIYTRAAMDDDWFLFENVAQRVAPGAPVVDEGGRE